jgi:hypothetical protein
MGKITIRGSRGARSNGAKEPTRAAIMLDRVLSEDGPIARALRKAFIRSQLRRWRTAKRKPDIDGVLEVERLTKGMIAPKHWRSTPAKAQG